MKMRVVHRTAYAYGDPVSTSHHEARLVPRDGTQQRTLSHDLDVVPAPAVMRERLDYFGNRTMHIHIREAHRALTVTATSVVDVTPSSIPMFVATPPWDEVRDRLARDRRRDVLDAYAHTFDSTHIKVTNALADYAAPSFERGRPLLDGARDLCSRIHNDFVYDTQATDVSTPLGEVLRHRRGVCQDFAHLAIGCLRAMGLGARYVSGYLLTRPPPGKPKLIGSDASHAWFGVFVPDYGWVDFDPTNDVVPSDEHVSVACGRDFADVTPVRGVILGGGRHEVKVSVDVVVVG